PEKWGAKQELEVLNSFDAQKCRDLFAKFVKNQTWQDPTLVVFQKMILPEKALLGDNRLNFLPAWQREEWKSFVDLRRKRTRTEIAYGESLWRMNLKLVGDMQKAGVRIMAGSDAPVSFVYPGFSLQDELSLLVQAGLTPLEA